MEKNQIYYGVKKVKEDKTEYFAHIFFNLKQTEFCAGKNDIYQIKMIIHENQKDLHNPNSINEINYIGWIISGNNFASMIYPSYDQFSCCFSYGYEILEKRGDGKAYRLKIIESKLLEKK